MIRFDSSDKILSNIARVVDTRLKDRNVTLTLILDPSMKELESSYENGVIRGGSYGDSLYVAGKYLRNPKMENGSFQACFYKQIHQNKSLASSGKVFKRANNYILFQTQSSAQQKLMWLAESCLLVTVLKNKNCNHQKNQALLRLL